MEYPDLWPKEEKICPLGCYCIVLVWRTVRKSKISSQKAHVQSVVKGRAVLMTVDAPKREIQLQKETLK
jgi:hypothetical protein